MLSRSLLARPSPLRLTAALTTRASLRSLTTLRLAYPTHCVVTPRTNLRRFSAALASHTETRDDARSSPAPSGTCYIANVPYKVTAEQLKDALSEFGKVESVRLLTTDSGLSRGVGFVHFGSVTDAVKFIETNEVDPIFVLDRQLHAAHAQKMASVPKPVEPCDTLMMLGFRGESADEVRAMFGSYADDIVAVRFDRKDVDRPSKKAFVQFQDVGTATEAMDAFRSQSENPQILYARQRQTPDRAYSLTSRLSQHRDE